MRRQGSQVSMRMARGSWSSLSSHGKRLGSQEALSRGNRDIGVAFQSHLVGHASSRVEAKVKF